MMLNTACFISQNASGAQTRIVIEKGKIVFRCSATIFDGELIKSILQYVNQIIIKRPIRGIPVQFLFLKEIKFSDKLIYVLFECICYELIQSGHPVYVQMTPVCKITTHGYASSPLLLLSTGKSTHVEKFQKKFVRDLYGRHFRRILPNDARKDELSILMDEIAIFQKPFDIKEEEREKIAEVLIELVGNATEHSEGDCLMDFDITDRYIKHGAGDKNYLGINIVILNFSKALIGTSLKCKLNEPGKLTERYQLVQKAYDAHRPYFDGQYLPEDFYNIAAFQHRISGRPGNGPTGGTGLTKLIQSLEEDSDAYSCYVISGRRGLQFKQEYMSYNADCWIGFNDTNDFLGLPPKNELLRKNPFFIPGTAYNLTFVMEVT